MHDNPVVHVIDDDDAARDSLSFLLRSAKIEVRTYETASAFLDSIKSLSLGCIITDVRMPEMTGIELLRRLRESGTDVPVIVITGHGDIPMAVEAMKFGASDFFEKPYDDELLVLLSGSRSIDRKGCPEKGGAFSPGRASGDPVQP
jgi:Response regulator